MTDKEFCELDSQFYGEEISNIKQIAFRSFDGDELKEYVEHCIKLSKLSQHDVIKTVCERCLKEKELKVCNECYCSSMFE